MREGVKINLRECGGTFRVVTIVVYLLSFMKIRASLYVRHIFIYIYIFFFFLMFLEVRGSGGIQLYFP